MANTDKATKQFLDYAGLSTLWGIITNRFADKTASVSKLTITTSTDGKTQTLVGSMIDSTAAPTSVVLPNASDEHAGLMSIEHFTAIRDLQTNIDKFAPFAGLQLGDATNKNEVSLTGRKATIGLKYLTERGNDGTATKAYIALLDPTYPTSGRWEEIDEAKYTAAPDKTSYVAVKQENGTYKYYIWTNANEGATGDALTPAGVAGPVNALGEPIYAQPISKIDVTELLKTGLLSNSNVVINPAGQNAGTYLELTFNAVNEDGTPNLQTQYINVTDLVEIYSAGEGIAITEESGTGADDTARTGKINVVAATESTLGAMKIGYTEGNKTYAVKLDADNKAYVAVPWNETTVSVSTPSANVTEGVETPIYGVDQDGKPYLVVTDNTTTVDNTDGSKTTKYAYSVSVGEGIRNAEALARTGVQQIVVNDTYAEGDTQAKGTDYLVISDPVSLGGKGTKITVDLTSDAKDSLKLADEAVQSITAGQYTASDRPNATGSNDILVTLNDGSDAKGEKGYTVSLGDRTKASLNLADTAVQSINMMGTTLDKEHVQYTAEQATLAMSLGSAANVNVTEDGTLAEASLKSYVNGPGEDKTERKTVATAEAVKTYVDTTAAATKTAYEGFVNTKIEALDSDTTATKLAAASTAQNEEAQTVFTKIVIEDGKLVDSKCEKAAIKIADISDFCALTEDQIYTICGVTKPTPAPTPGE